MSITEHERNQLYVWFEEHMGKERANAMMSLLPPVGWADVATKRDVDAVASAAKRDLEVATARIDGRFDSMEARFDAIDHRFDSMEARFEAIDHRFDSMEARFEAIDHRFGSIDARFGSVDDRLSGLATKTELQEFRSDLQRTFVTWLFASQASVIAAIGLFIAFFR